ncbi:MAG: hypothetical protein ACRDFB_05660, partial [Rhabdochlamydiaceae bacterium]
EGWEYKQKKNKELLKPTFSMYYGFHGIGESDEESKKQGYLTTRYSVSCQPVCDLAYLPVKLNKKVEVYHFKPNSGKPDIIFTGESNFSLLEVLGAIFDDISVHRGPSEGCSFFRRNEKDS